MNGKYGYIDKAGKWVIQPRFDYGGDFSEGLARVVLPDNTATGYIDKTGKIVIQPQFEEGWNFSEGLAPVYQNDQWHYIDPPARLCCDSKTLDGVSLTD